MLKRKSSNLVKVFEDLSKKNSESKKSLEDNQNSKDPFEIDISKLDLSKEAEIFQKE
jgi:hypothetical protein